MASPTCKYGNLETALASLDGYLVAINELQVLLLQMPRTCLVSDLGKLMCLVETAKATLTRNGVSMHTFASCPARLEPYKSAYFSFLTRLKEHTRHVRFTSDETDARVRLSHLLFPLSTQLKFCKKPVHLDYQRHSYQKFCSPKFTGKSDCNEAEKVAPLHALNHIIHLESAPLQRSAPPLWNFSTTVPTIPDNVMLPPPTPLHCARSHSSYLECSNRLVPAVWKCSDVRDEPPKVLPSARTAASVRRASQCQSSQLKRKRPYGDNVPSHPAEASPPSSEDEEESSSADEKAADRSDSDSNDTSSDRGDEDSEDELESEEENDGDDDEEDDISMDHGRSAKVARIVVPERSPLRRSFGIFCTGKGHGAFNGTAHLRSPRPSLTRRNMQLLKSPRS